MRISQTHIKGIGRGFLAEPYLNVWVCKNGVMLTWNVFRRFNVHFLGWPWRWKALRKIKKRNTVFFAKENRLLANRMLGWGASDDTIRHTTGLLNWSKTN